MPDFWLADAWREFDADREIAARAIDARQQAEWIWMASAAAVLDLLKRGVTVDDLRREVAGFGRVLRTSPVTYSPGNCEHGVSAMRTCPRCIARDFS